MGRSEATQALARYGEPEASHRKLATVPQETLAEMVRTTRSRVNFFMNKFRKLGFIGYNGGLKQQLSSECSLTRLTVPTAVTPVRPAEDAPFGAASQYRAWIKSPYGG